MNASLIATFSKHFTRNAILLQRISKRNVLLSAVNSYHCRNAIGSREVVGYGINGSYIYFDRPDFPMPAIRFREDDAAMTALRAKEKGNWKQLSIEEKKALYRASYCSTFAEITAPTGEWKSILAGVLGWTAFTLFIFGLSKEYIYPPLPKALTPEGKKRALRDAIMMEVDPVDGISSKWDYEKNRWKE